MFASHILLAVVEASLFAPSIALADIYHTSASPTIYANPTHDTLESAFSASAY